MPSLWPMVSGRAVPWHLLCSISTLPWLLPRGVSRSTQWQDRVTSEDIAKRVRLPADIRELLRCHRLRWLGHIARMDSSRLPKQVLFGELPSRGPSHGPRKRWRDVARSNLAVVGIPESDWYDVAQDRGEWRKLSRRPPPGSAKSFQCMWGGTFRRARDLKRHFSYCSARALSPH